MTSTPRISMDEINKFMNVSKSEHDDSQRCRQIIGQLLEYTKAESASKEHFDIEVWSADRKRWFTITGKIDQEEAINYTQDLEASLLKEKFRVMRIVSKCTLVYP